MRRQITLVVVWHDLNMFSSPVTPVIQQHSALSSVVVLLGVCLASSASVFNML